MQDIPKYEDLKEPENAKSLLAHTAVLKLNGGLGTSMGLEKAKSMLVVKEGKNFLDLIAEQVRTADLSDTYVPARKAFTCRLQDSLCRQHTPHASAVRARCAPVCSAASHAAAEPPLRSSL